MIGRCVAVFAITFATLVPLSSAFATADHAQRIAAEVAQRRAQVRAALCQQRVPAADLKLPTYPPVGTGGAVPLPPCPASTR